MDSPAQGHHEMTFFFFLLDLFTGVLDESESISYLT